MEAKCQAMMAEREKMMTGMKAADQRLDDLVAKMNTASGMETDDEEHGRHEALSSRDGVRANPS